jgi:hypothetical protein
MSISGRYARDGSESAELEGGFALRAEGVEAMRRAASAISRGVESGAPNAYYEDPPRKRCRLDWCRCVGRATAVRDPPVRVFPALAKASKSRGWSA